MQLLPLNGRITRFHVLSRVSDWENETFNSSGGYIPIVNDEASLSREDEFQICIPHRNKTSLISCAPQRLTLFPITRTASMASTTETAEAYGLRRVYALHMRAISSEPSISRLTSS